MDPLAYRMSNAESIPPEWLLALKSNLFKEIEGFEEGAVSADDSAQSPDFSSFAQEIPSGHSEHVDEPASSEVSLNLGGIHSDFFRRCLQFQLETILRKTKHLAKME